MNAPEWIELDPLLRHPHTPVDPQTLAALLDCTVICDDDAATAGAACWYAVALDAAEAAAAYAQLGGTPSTVYPGSLEALGPGPYNCTVILRALDDALLFLGYRLTAEAPADAAPTLVAVETGAPPADDDADWCVHRRIVERIADARTMLAEFRDIMIGRRLPAPITNAL
jgi:hypothetical protein